MILIVFDPFIVQVGHKLVLEVHAALDWVVVSRTRPREWLSTTCTAHATSMWLLAVLAKGNGRQAPAMPTLGRN